MKETTIGDFKIAYPVFAFAFNPIPVFVSLKDDLVGADDRSVRIKVVGENTSVEIVRDMYNRKTVFDLSAVARNLFDRTQFHKLDLFDTTLLKKMKWQLIEKKKTEQGKEEEIILWTSDEISVFWGAMQIGETYSQSKRLKMFKGYPFTVPLYLHEVSDSEDGKPLIQYIADGRGVQTLPKPQPNFQLASGKYNIDVSSINANKEISLVINMGKNNSTFDITFDYTFRGFGVDSVTIDVDLIDTCDAGGYYLRWIDKHGEYHYWLFKEGVRSSQIENNSVVFEEYFSTTNYSEGYHVGSGKSVGKEVQKSVQLFSNFVDADDFDFLLGLAESPIVDLLTHYDKTQNEQTWMSVNIQPGTFPKGKEYLQDFGFNLLLPKTFRQSL